jgi:hypothetical protein
VISDEWLLEWNESQDQSAYWDSLGTLLFGVSLTRFRRTLGSMA